MVGVSQTGKLQSHLLPTKLFLALMTGKKFPGLLASKSKKRELLLLPNPLPEMSQFRAPQLLWPCFLQFKMLILWPQWYQGQTCASGSQKHIRLAFQTHFLGRVSSLYYPLPLNGHLQWRQFLFHSQITLDPKYAQELKQVLFQKCRCMSALANIPLQGHLTGPSWQWADRLCPGFWNIIVLFLWH